MRKNFALTLLALAATILTFATQANAGTEMITDNSAQAPPPQYYNYAPPPRVVYYAPPPPRVVVYAPAVSVHRVYAYHRPYVRRSHFHHHPFWR